MHFTIAGEGEERSFLENMIKEQGLSKKVTMLGHTDAPENFYPTIDILLFTSAYEGTARTILESMACGVPVICFDISSMKEIVQNDLNGQLIPAFDTDACYQKLNKLLINTDKIKNLSSNCRNFIKTQFNKSTIFKKWEDHILEGL